MHLNKSALRSMGKYLYLGSCNNYEIEEKSTLGTRFAQWPHNIKRPPLHTYIPI